VRARISGLANQKTSAARYLLVGAVSYGFDIAILALCWHVLELPLWLATSLGFWASFVVNFLLSRHWTFEAGHRAPGGQLARYGVLVGINYVVTILAMMALHRAGFGVVAARTITLAVLTISTFLIYRGWVFAQREVSDE
jgi:putative flippase GtrA